MKLSDFIELRGPDDEVEDTDICEDNSTMSRLWLMKEHRGYYLGTVTFSYGSIVVIWETPC